MIARVHDFLLATLFAILAGTVGVAGWKLITVLDKVQETLIVAQDALSIGRSAMAEQRIYYRALSKMVVHDANRLGKGIGAAEQAIHNEDGRLAESHQQLDRLVAELQRTAVAGTDEIQQAGASTATLGQQIEAVSADSRQLLAQGATILDTVDERLKDPALTQTSANLAQSAANLERMSAAGAESAERVRDILSPKKRSFWMRLLELMIPRPTVRVAP